MNTDRNALETRHLGSRRGGKGTGFAMKVGSLVGVACRGGSNGELAEKKLSRVPLWFGRVAELRNASSLEVV